MWSPHGLLKQHCQTALMQYLALPGPKNMNGSAQQRQRFSQIHASLSSRVWKNLDVTNSLTQEESHLIYKKNMVLVYVLQKVGRTNIYVWIVRYISHLGFLNIEMKMPCTLFDKSESPGYFKLVRVFRLQWTKLNQRNLLLLCILHLKTKSGISYREKNSTGQCGPSFRFVFSCPADSSIGDLVTDSLTHWVSETPFEKHNNRVTPETCDLWDIWSEW